MMAPTTTASRGVELPPPLPRAIRRPLQVLSKHSTSRFAGTYKSLRPSKNQHSSGSSSSSSSIGPSVSLTTLHAIHKKAPSQHNRRATLYTTVSRRCTHRPIARCMPSVPTSKHEDKHDRKTGAGAGASGEGRGAARTPPLPPGRNLPEDKRFTHTRS